MFGGLQQLREGRTPPPPTEPQLTPREDRGPQHGRENGAKSGHHGAASQQLSQGDVQMQDVGCGYGLASPYGTRHSQRNGGAPLSQLTDPFRSQPSGSQQLQQPGASQRQSTLGDPLPVLNSATPTQDWSTQDARTQPSLQQWPPQPHSQPDLHSQHSQQRRLQQLQAHGSGAQNRCDGRSAPLQQLSPLPPISAQYSQRAAPRYHSGSQISATWQSQVSGLAPSLSPPSWEGAPHAAQASSALDSQQRPSQLAIGPSSSSDPASVPRGQAGSLIAAGQAQALGVFADDSDAEDFADFAVEDLDQRQLPQQDAPLACRAQPNAPAPILLGGAFCAQTHDFTQQDSTLLQVDNIHQCATATDSQRDAGGAPLVGLQRPSWQLEGAGSPLGHQHPRTPDPPLLQQQPGQQPQMQSSLQQAHLPPRPTNLWQPQGCDVFPSQATVIALLGTCGLNAFLNIISLIF